MKGMNRKAMALAAMMVAAAGTPALAQADQQTMPMNQQVQPSQQTSSMTTTATSDALETQVPPLTYTVAEDRMAAITYMDDALKLIDLGETAIQAGNLDEARSVLIGASGKLTTAYLLNFRDRQFSRQIMPLTMRVQDAMNVLDSNSQQALSTLSNLRDQVASIAETQLATMGGGGGGAMTGYEEIEVIDVDETAPPSNMNELNVPDSDEID